MKLFKTGPVEAEGHLTYDPEMRFTASGKAVTNFWMDTLDGKQLQCVLWESLAESMAQDGRRGMGIIIHGEWTVRMYTDMNGNERAIQSVLVKQYEWNKP